MDDTYSPYEIAWQLMVAAVLDDDPREDTSGREQPNELDELLTGANDDVIAVLFSVVGYAAKLVELVATGAGISAEEAVKRLGVGLAEEGM